MCYTRGQVSVNKRNSVLSNYFDVSFEIYYVRLKYIDSIGQVVKLLILRPASIYCTFKRVTRKTEIHPMTEIRRKNYSFCWNTCDIIIYYLEVYLSYDMRVHQVQSQILRRRAL